MSWLTDIARPEIRALRAYEHAAWEPGLVRLHANESPWRGLGDDSQAGLNRYPEPHPLEMSAALAQFYQVEPDMLLACRGSDEAIDLLIRGYCRAGSDAILVCPPTFGMYGVAARVQGAAVVEIPLLRELGYACDFAAVAAPSHSAVKLVFLCSPNNPTGNRFDSAAIIALARALSGRALVVVDEAYVEFADGPSLIAQLATQPGLVVLRTLSKAYALAGARCGALIAHRDVVALLRKVIQPYAITQLTIEAVFRMLEPEALDAARALCDPQVRAQSRRGGPGHARRRAPCVAQRNQFPAGGIRRPARCARARARRRSTGARSACRPGDLARGAHQHRQAGAE